jgi:hypothetical protein
MAADCGNIEKDADPVQHGEYHHVMDHDTSSHECLKFSDHAGDPVRGVFLEESVEVAEIFIRAVSRGCAYALQRGNDKSRGGTD